jgi:hypothetical protein
MYIRIFERSSALSRLLMISLGQEEIGKRITGLALGAQAGERRLREVLSRGGFTRVRRAAKTPLRANIVIVGEGREGGVGCRGRSFQLFECSLPGLPSIFSGCLRVGALHELFAKTVGSDLRPDRQHCSR